MAELSLKFSAPLLSLKMFLHRFQRCLTSAVRKPRPNLLIFFTAILTELSGAQRGVQVREGSGAEGTTYMTLSQLLRFPQPRFPLL